MLKEFRQDVLLRYFDLTKPTFIFVDAHITGLGAILAQGDDIISTKLVAFASRTTSQAESQYPQLDLEARALILVFKDLETLQLDLPTRSP